MLHFQDHQTVKIFIQELREFLEKKKQRELLIKLMFLENYISESEDIISELITLTKAEAINDFEEKYNKRFQI